MRGQDDILQRNYKTFLADWIYRFQDLLFKEAKTRAKGE